MKKLIYAEDLKKEIEAWGYGLTYKDCLNEIEKAPIVNAIPIEWIEKWADRKCDYDIMRVGNWENTHKYANEIIKDWENENEADK